MTRMTTDRTRIARRTTFAVSSLLIAASGTASAHGTVSGGGTMGGGMMDGGTWGLFGGAMGLWGLLWMGLLIAAPVVLVYAMAERRSGQRGDDPLSVVRQRYARGELTDEEFQTQRNALEQSK